MIKRSAAFQQAAKLLPSLSVDELKQLRAHAGERIGNKSERIKGAVDYYLEGITVELRRRGSWPHDRTLPARQMAPAYYQVGVPAWNALLVCIDKKLNVQQLTQLGQIAGRVLVNYLITVRVGIEPKWVLTNSGRLAPAFEESFPGYLDSGLIGCTLGLWD